MLMLAWLPTCRLAATTEVFASAQLWPLLPVIYFFIFSDSYIALFVLTLHILTDYSSALSCICICLPLRLCTRQAQTLK